MVGVLILSYILFFYWCSDFTLNVWLFYEEIAASLLCIALDSSCYKGDDQFV